MRLLFDQRAEELKEKIYHVGRESYFVNDNAALDDTRQETVQELARRMVDPPGTLRVLMHSLAFGTLKPLAGAEEVINRHQLELTTDVMGHSLVYWVQACLEAGLMDRGARIFAMTSIGGSRAVPNSGPVSTAKAVSVRGSTRLTGRVRSQRQQAWSSKQRLFHFGGERSA
jgi:enoyl-[acyl-carrier protein] reductase III